MLSCKGETAEVKQAAEKLDTEGGGGFQPPHEARIFKPALATERCFSPISTGISSFSAVCLAPEGRLPSISHEIPSFSAACKAQK
jgi:hypothetical protein